MYVDLVKAIKKVAKEVYGLDSVEGVWVDVWGDGMLRGLQPIVRLCFRFLRCPSKPWIEFNCQSRNETFTFAVFCGKDSLLNMERNLMSFTIAGEKGWLYEQTELLVEVEKVHLTASGDAPWMSKLVDGGKTDEQSLSTARIWFPDPDQKALEGVLVRFNLTLKDLITKRHQPRIQRALSDIDCVLPQNAFYGTTPADPRNGYRTEIKATIDHKLPKCSMVYMKGTGCICIDGFHQSVRVAEKDAKLSAEFLLEKKRVEHLKQVSIILVYNHSI